MKDYKGYLIDLDGTMYRGTESIREAVEFVGRLKEKNIPYLFVTNNSSRRPAQVADKLANFGIHATEEHVFTTSQATASYMKSLNKGDKAYVIGEEGIRSSLEEVGFTLVEEETPDFVVVGIDRSINYEKLAKACLGVRAGATFISTNGDIAIPTERGLLPGNGSLTSVVSVSTQVQPIFIGKPEAIIMEQALAKLGLPKEEVVMVGDNYDTDIMAGIKAGIDTLMVHTGVTSPDNLRTRSVQPTFAISCLSEWEL
ncbi:TIGR01457 family HAD-type hydrolase [Mangrovibacillus cuniculi]|uniref:TIGR01457 family HAD-type hydrolase n=1 Tax=Mangrovibacillus cuniculi TaxID=2593652 RepID=A0A7S8CCL9_9BACI|nr:TIGR01457 family HAD-type hydrolase [Mangrovibacillus cuniculi]QPC47381.1 TIGR01457 family HAD-type hydrolase [Mangrovibacillus cuniculi]